MVMDLYHEPDDDAIIGTIDKEILTDHGPPKKRKKQLVKRLKLLQKTIILVYMIFSKKSKLYSVVFSLVPWDPIRMRCVMCACFLKF